MPRQHKADANDDTYLCDTDGYRLQSGCYNNIRIPDGHVLRIKKLSPGDYYGPIVVGPDNASLFSLVEESWQNGGKVTLTVKEPSERGHHYVATGEEQLRWHVDVQAMPIFGSRESGRTLIWPEFTTGVKFEDKPFIENVWDVYYPLKLRSKYSPDQSGFETSLEVEFVYKGDVN